MMYCFWDMERGKENFCFFWAIFCPFTPLTTQKIRILKKWKKGLEILSFYTSVPQMTILWFMAPEIWNVTDIIFCHFVIFCTFTPLTTHKIKNFENMKINAQRYYHFTQGTINENHMIYDSWDMEHDRQYFLSFWVSFCSCAHEPGKYKFWKYK